MEKLRGSMMIRTSYWLQCHWGKKTFVTGLKVGHEETA
jgi:hypothetical protein